MFKNLEVKTAFEVWMNSHPESSHQLDLNRFYDFVYKSWKFDETLKDELFIDYVKKNTKWIDEFVEEFVTEKSESFYQFTNFLDFLQENNRLNEASN